MKRVNVCVNRGESIQVQTGRIPHGVVEGEGGEWWPIIQQIKAYFLFAFFCCKNQGAIYFGVFLHISGFLPLSIERERQTLWVGHICVFSANIPQNCYCVSNWNIYFFLLIHLLWYLLLVMSFKFKFSMCMRSIIFRERENDTLSHSLLTSPPTHTYYFNNEWSWVFKIFRERPMRFYVQFWQRVAKRGRGRREKPKNLRLM